MEEKIYKIMRGAGALNIVLGVISGSRNCGRSTADHQRRQAYLRQIPHPVLRTKEKKGAAWARRLGIST